MNKGDKARFAVVMNWLAEKFPQKDGQPRQLTKKELGDWFEALQDLNIDNIEWGAKHLFAHSLYFPKPLELRAATKLAPPRPVPPMKQLADLTPPEVARARLREIFERLDTRFGTSLTGKEDAR